jgi:hypothetical protein
MRFALGDRVRISPEYTWAQGATGTIAMPPDFVVDLVKDEGSGHLSHAFEPSPPAALPPGFSLDLATRRVLR